MAKARKKVATNALVPICAIGGSAGGIRALKEFFGEIDPHLGIAYVVILHLAPDYPSQLAPILAAATEMDVLQVEDSPQLKPNCVYVIAPDRELVINGDHIHSRPFAEPRGLRAPIDRFFQSVAEARGDGFAVILSGAGSDGAIGVRRIKEAAGLILVQDPMEAEFPMMPRSAIATGAADFIEPVKAMTRRIAELLHSKRVLAETAELEADEQVLRIVSFLRARTGHDFSSYKPATVRRRIGRRMQVTRQDSLASYVRYLSDTPEEAQELFSDLLISVTSFFRDPSAFDRLAKSVIPSLFDDCGSDGTIRAWVVGCATGEEAYTLAILMLEEAQRREIRPNIQIFASDLDEGALATAREGRYPRAIEADLSEERLRRNFVEEVEHYRVRKEVRDLVLFAHHSAVKDPPFMRLNLITCRNLLIYLERELQQRLLAIFHYALQSGNYIFLGSAETADARNDLFFVLDRAARIYSAKPRSDNAVELLGRFPAEPFKENSTFRAEPRREHSPGGAHASALERLSPPSALVDEDHRIVNLSPNAGRFILPPEGPMSRELPDVVRPELRAELRSALHRAFGVREPTLTLPVNVAFNGNRHRVIMHVSGAMEHDREAPLVLVTFMDGGPVAEVDDAVEDEATVGSAEVRRLREELRTAQERLSASRREHEAAIQEARISNEELQSVNEEYRSTAEELETSKEELQSINEELQTVNSELKSKLDNIANAQDAREVLNNLTPLEREVPTKDDRWLVMRLRPYRTVEDRIDGVVLTFVEISEHRAAVDAQKRSETRYRDLCEQLMNDAISSGADPKIIEAARERFEAELES